MMHGWKYLFPECSILIRQFDEYDSPFSKPGEWIMSIFSD
jgi:hypothetical protein